MAEPASFFNDEIEIPKEFSSLPANIKGMPAMREGLRFVQFSSKLSESRFTRCWMTSPAERLLTSFVWRTICTRIVPDAQSAERLFSELAGNYARLFSSTVYSAEAKDVLTWYLPEALVRTTSYVLQCAFPRSRYLFDAKFSANIFSEFISYTSGFTGMCMLKMLEFVVGSISTNVAPQRKRMSAPGGARGASWRRRGSCDSTAGLGKFESITKNGSILTY